MSSVMKQIVTLVGMQPKKGTGTLDNGQAWETDRIDLHCLVPLDAEKGCKGSSVTVYKLAGHDTYLSPVSALVGQKVELGITFVAGQIGQAPKVSVVSIGKAA